MISILCPSRGRPTLAKYMIDTAMSTAQTDIEILLYLNNDDPALDEYKNIINNRHILVGNDRSPNYTWNKLSEIATHDIMFLVSDDAWFETQSWDHEVIKVFNEYPDRIAFVFPSIDNLPWKTGIAPVDSCPHYFLHKNWIKAVGYFTPPQFWHWFSDLYWKKCALSIGRFRKMTNIHIPCQLELVDETEKRKDIFSNRERDIWLWTHSSIDRLIKNDVIALQDFINNYR